jgi:glucokinase
VHVWFPWVLGIAGRWTCHGCVGRIHALADYPYRQGITAKRISELAQDGDKFAQQAVEREAFYLGSGLANLINLFTPDAIVCAGSVMKSAAIFLDRLLAVIGSGCRFVPAEKTHLVLASLGEDTNLIGAARVWHYRCGGTAPEGGL